MNENEREQLTKIMETHQIKCPLEKFAPIQSPSRPKYPNMKNLAKQNENRMRYSYTQTLIGMQPSKISPQGFVNDQNEEMWDTQGANNNRNSKNMKHLQRNLT